VQVFEHVGQARHLDESDSLHLHFEVLAILSSVSLLLRLGSGLLQSRLPSLQRCFNRGLPHWISEKVKLSEEFDRLALSS
jgi:hypothetical protein